MSRGSREPLLSRAVGGAGGDDNHEDTCHVRRTGRGITMIRTPHALSG